jgi:chorismate mutase/prephenate dehydratase
VAKKKSAKGAGTTGSSAGSKAKLNQKPGQKPADAKPQPLAPIPQARLDEIRALINRLDGELIRVLNDRSELVVEVGKLKQKAGLPIYTPHREVEVIERALKHHRSLHGVLPERTVEAVYRELMSGSFTLQQPLRIGYLGPPGSFSHSAAVRHFGSSVDFEDLHEIAGVFTEVRRAHVNYGMVPIENSTGGGIVETMDAFRNTRGEVSIIAEVQMEVHHAMLANCPPKAVRRIHSKPEVFSQCRIWLATQYPKAELIAAASSSRAAQTAAEESKMAVSIGHEPSSAAIGSELAGQIYELNTLFSRIEDNASNITRFFVISRQKAQRTGDDKTSMMFQTADKPGALVSVLQVFDRAGINLTHIDKRPSGRENWTYTFFIDAQGHRDDPVLAAAIEEASGHCEELIVLGSYPRSRRIL